MESSSTSSAAAGTVEVALASVGRAASGAGEWLSTRGSATLVKARPWLEFCDLSAIKPVAPGGPSEYVARLSANASYFRFNYLQVGLALALLGTVTQPMCLLGALLLVAAYFHLFGAEAEEEVHVFGLVLDHQEKVGALVVLGAVVFWFAAGGFGLFSAIVCSTAFVALVHGCLRVPPPEAEPVV
jgi:hypothetical protein